MRRESRVRSTDGLRARISCFCRVAWFALAAWAVAENIGAQAWNVEFVGQIGGSCYAVHVEGNYAYIGEKKRLRILDVSDPSRPVALGGVLLPGTVYGVYVSGELAYVADGPSGLQIIDVSKKVGKMGLTRRGSMAPPQGGYDSSQRTSDFEMNQ